MGKSYLIYENVIIGKKPKIGTFVIIGEGNKGMVTHIGDNALIRSHTIIYSGNSIGHHFQTGHGVLLREKNRIGNDVSIGTHTVIEHHVTIGNNVRIHSGAFIPEYSILEDDCWIGPHVVLTNAKYPKSKNVKKKLQGPCIKKGAIIGANVTILPGVIIGENTLVGAGSVVTEKIPANYVVAGSPAKKINVLKNLPYA